MYYKDILFDTEHGRNEWYQTMLLIKAIAAQNRALWLRNELTDQQFQNEGKLWLDDTIAPWIAWYGVAKVPEDIR